MAEYIKTNWVDHIEDPVTGEIYQQGTNVDASNLNHMEDGIATAQTMADGALKNAILGGEPLEIQGDTLNLPPYPIVGDVFVEFTEATTRQNISSGEHISTAFGKLAKTFADTKTVAFSGSYNDLSNKPTSLPANGGNANTVGNLTAADLKTYTNTELAKAKVYTLTHTKSGTTHTLTGLPTTSGIYSCVFKATADFIEGNTFSGGYTAKPNGEDTALPDKAFVVGDIVSVTVDTVGKKIGFSVGFTGGEMNKPLVAGGELLNTLPQVRNIVYYPVGTDPNSLDVPIGTEIAILEE